MRTVSHSVGRIGAEVRPWWHSSMMFDAVDTGGIGVTAPIFRHIGQMSEDPLSSFQGLSETDKTVLSTAALIGGSTIGGLLGYGLYGYLRDHNWGTWEAGAMTGLMGGIGALTILFGVGWITGKKFVG